MQAAVTHPRQVISRSRMLVALLWLTWLFCATHVSVGAVEVLGRYSTRYAALLAVSLVASIFSTALLWGPLPGAARLEGRLRSPIWAALFALTGGTLWALNLEPMAKLFPTALLVAAAIWLLPREAEDAQAGGLWRALRVALPILLIAGLALQIVAILWQPYIHSHDEGAYSQIALDYLTSGRLGGDLYGYPPRHFVGFGWWLATLAGWYQVFGFGWLAGRLYTVTLSALALAAIYAAGTRLNGWKTGLLAAVIMGLSPSFVHLHQIRPDALMVLMVSLILLAFFTAQQGRKPWQYFALGFVGMLSLEVHLLGAAFWGVAGGLLGLEWLGACWKARKPVWSPALFWFILGSLLPAAFFVVTHLLPDRGVSSAIVVTPKGHTIFTKFTQELTRWKDYMQVFPLELVLTLGAVGLAIQRREKEDRLLLGWFGWLLLAYVAIAPTVYPQYTRYFLPVQALLIARMLSQFPARLPAAAALLVPALLGGLLLGDSLNAVNGRPADAAVFERPTPAIVTYLEETVPAGEPVVMSSYYYMYQTDPHRYVFRVPGIHPPTIEMLGGPLEADVYRVLNPALIVLDERFEYMNPWIDRLVNDEGYVYLPQFEGDGLEVYLRPDLAGELAP